MRSLRRYVGHRLVIQRGEQTLDGTLTDATREVLVLSGTTLISGGNPVQLDGEVAIPSIGIDWAQVV